MKSKQSPENKSVPEKSQEVNSEQRPNKKGIVGKQIFQHRAMYALYALIAILLIWYILTDLSGLIPQLFLPGPVKVANTFVILLEEGYRDYSLYYHVGISMMRVLLAFLAACAIGIPVGLFMALNKHVEFLIDPIIELYRPIPPIALIPLFIIWLGIGELSKIGIIFIAIFAVIVINTVAGVKAMSQTKIWVAQTLGAKKWGLFRHITLPGAFPSIFTGMRVGIGFGWTTLVAAEMIAAKSGIGWMALNARRFLRTDIIICGVLLMGITGLLIDRLLRAIELYLVPWKGKE